MLQSCCLNTYVAIKILGWKMRHSPNQLSHESHRKFVCVECSYYWKTLVKPTKQGALPFDLFLNYIPSLEENNDTLKDIMFMHQIPKVKIFHDLLIMSLLLTKSSWIPNLIWLLSIWSIVLLLHCHLLHSSSIPSFVLLLLTLLDVMLPHR